MELDARLPNCPVRVNGEFVVLCEDGSVWLYCDGDVHLTLAELKEIAALADRFMYERENGRETAI